MAWSADRRHFEYTAAELGREARAAVKGKGRFIRWALALYQFESGKGCSVSLKCTYFSRELEAEQVTYMSI